MVMGDVLTFIVVVAVALERLVELHLSRRNTAWAIARGGVEVGQGAYRVMTAFHALFFVACVAEPLLLRRPFTPGIATACLVALLGAQALRWWAVNALGPQWNTRIIVIPGAAPVTSGPYRWIRHPNYVAVIVEMIALPMLHGGWMTALAASVGNGFLLRTRIRTEERALGAPWARAFAATPRFVPGGPRASA